MEKIKEKFDNEGVIELGRGFLTDKELSTHKISYGIQQECQR